MRLFSLLGLLLLAGCFSTNVTSQTVRGNGRADTRTERADGVREVGLAIPGTLVIEVGREHDLRIEGDANIVEQIRVERRGDHLEIRAPRNVIFQPDRPLRLTLGVERLNGVSLAGSGRIEAAGVRAGGFDVSLAGSGTVRIRDLRAESVDVSIAGSGDVTLDGRTDGLDVSIAGSGNALLGNLAARDVDVSIAGSGDATVRAEARLAASIMGSGDVRYYGNPSIDRSVMGSGNIARAN